MATPGTATDIHRLWPDPVSGPATDDDLARWYAPPPSEPQWLRMNFVSSLDGAATHEGRSGGLSDDADKRVFELLRTSCDAVLVGAGTARDEGYTAMRLPEPAVARRRRAGLADQPVFVLVSLHLALDPGSAIFADAPVRPIVITAESAPQRRADELAEVADILVCGKDRVEGGRARAALAERGLARIHSEGGPRLFADLAADGAVDELCLTLSPLIEGGSGPRIAHGAVVPQPAWMRLAHVLAAGDTLLLRYTRALTEA